MILLNLLQLHWCRIFDLEFVIFLLFFRDNPYMIFLIIIIWGSVKKKVRQLINYLFILVRFFDFLDSVTVLDSWIKFVDIEELKNFNLFLK
jgi:hypothetical protein